MSLSFSAEYRLKAVPSPSSFEERFFRLLSCSLPHFFNDDSVWSANPKNPETGIDESLFLHGGYNGSP